jgi:hypothetical protein
MTDHDLPPEFRRRNSHPEALPLELPLDDEATQPPVQNSDRVPAVEEGGPDPFLRRS